MRHHADLTFRLSKMGRVQIWVVNNGPSARQETVFAIRAFQAGHVRLRIRSWPLKRRRKGANCEPNLSGCVPYTCHTGYLYDDLNRNKDGRAGNTHGVMTCQTTVAYGVVDDNAALFNNFVLQTRDGLWLTVFMFE